MRVLNRLIGSFALTVSSWAIGLTAIPRNHVLNLPPRPDKALSGTAFMKKIDKYSPSSRENAIVKEILRGNVPSFMRQLIPVATRMDRGPYKGQIVRFWTLPDYLAVGSDQDYVRVPLNLYSIDKIAMQLDLSLPTRKMVDEIYQAASVKLKPAPVPYSSAVASTGNIMKHHLMVQSQLAPTLYARPGLLLAGHKKDVVQTRRLMKKPQSIAIYGWHQMNAKPIQPLSTVHSAAYADYSHGIRLVGNEIEIGGRSMDLREVLGQRLTASTFSDEGAIPQRSALVLQTRPKQIVANYP